MSLYIYIYVLKIAPRQSWHICLRQREDLHYFRCLVKKDEKLILSKRK